MKTIEGDLCGTIRADPKKIGSGGKVGEVVI